MSKVRTPIRRVDSNQRALVDDLRTIPGLSILDIHALGNGFDLVVGFRGETWVVEVKVPGGKLRPGQQGRFDAWAGRKAVWRCIEDALRDLGLAHLRR